MVSVQRLRRIWMKGPRNERRRQKMPIAAISTLSRIGLFAGLNRIILHLLLKVKRIRLNGLNGLGSMIRKQRAVETSKHSERLRSGGMQNTERNDLLEWEGPPDEYDRISAEEFITGKKPLKAIALLIVAASALFGQAVRIDPQPTTTTAGNQPPGTYQPILAVPGSTIKICANSSCSVSASTYTDQTATALCDTAHPLVPRGTSGCASTADAQGNFGFWVVPGSYWYTIQFPNGNQFGPYPTSNGAAGKEGKAFPVICSAGACSQTILNLGLAGHNQGQNVGVWCFSGPLTADWKVTGNVVSCGANNDGLGDITFTWTGNTVQSLLVMGNGPGPMGPPGQGAINLVSVATYGVSGQCGDAGR